MRSIFHSIVSRLVPLYHSPVIRFSIHLAIVSSIFMLWSQAYAAEDPLSGTDASLIATLGSNGTGRKFIYLIEGVTAIATYIKTKNLMMFSGVVGIAIFLNILFKVAGVTG